MAEVATKTRTPSQWASSDPKEAWEEYERQKKHIKKWSRSQREYERRVAELARDLGI